MQYELRQYDTPLLSFYLERQELDKLTFNIDWVNEEKRYLLPIGLATDSDGIAKWLKSRVVPKNREYVDQILARSGLSHNDVMGIINVCKGLSLNDSYWVVDKEFEGKYADYNLYQNNFTRTLALIAYTGYGSNSKKGFTSSPEYTTNGMLRKCWRRINGKIYLFKGGTSGASNAGNEPYSEFYAAQIAETMGINHVAYNLSKWKGGLCSTCELFTDMDTSFVPIYKFNQGNSLSEMAKFLKGLGEEFYNDFADMMVFDALICNTDRHAGNYGLLVDNKTNKPIKFAP
ncbi:MAG: XRE family transcriptional regulator, partial [Ruminococcus sp.]